MNPVLERDFSENIIQEKYKKMIVTGTVIEVYEMDFKPYQLLNRNKRSNDSPDWIDSWEQELEEMNLQQRMENCSSLDDLYRVVREHKGRINANIYRTRNNVRRLSLANFDNGSKFVTFTFAQNITDVSEANQLWKKFIKRMRYKYGDFKYMAVIEFQKRGAVHYHVIWDLAYIKKSELSEIWSHGFVKINRIEHVDNVGAYIVKYMTKDLMDERFKGLKAYQCSKGLQRPLVLRGEQVAELYRMYGLEDKKTVFESSYTSEHHGTILYKEYNLKR